MVKKKKLTNKDRTPCEIYSRVVGYLRPVGQWNEGKVAEYKTRVEYQIEQ